MSNTGLPINPNRIPGRFYVKVDRYSAAEISEAIFASTDKLHHLIRKLNFKAFGAFVEAQQYETQKNVWCNAVCNPALDTADLVWIYEKVTDPEYNKYEWRETDGEISDINQAILKGIGLHKNTPATITETIRAMHIEGNPLITEIDEEAQRKYEKQIAVQVENKRNRPQTSCLPSP